MEKNLEDLSNNDIFFEMKQMEADYEALKIKLKNDYDKLEEIEARYAKANEIILKRIKRE